MKSDIYSYKGKIVFVLGFSQEGQIVIALVSENKSGSGKKFNVRADDLKPVGAVKPNNY